MRQFTLSRFSHIEALPSTETSSLVSGARRFGLSRFSVPGTLQSRQVSIDGAVATLSAGRVAVLDAKTVDAKSDLRGYIAFRQAFAIYGVHTFSEVDHVETDDIASVNTVPL